MTSTESKRDRFAPPASGHHLVQEGRGDWHCSCGARMSREGERSGRQRAREMMRFHRMDLEQDRQGKPTFMLIRENGTTTLYLTFTDAALRRRGTPVSGLLKYIDRAELH